MNITVYKSRYDKLYHAHVKKAFWRSGKTKTEAYEACQAAIEAQADEIYTRRYYWTNDGSLFVLYYADGWWYDIAHTDYERPGSHGLNYCTLEEAEGYVLDHITSNFGGLAKKQRSVA